MFRQAEKKMFVIPRGQKNRSWRVLFTLFQFVTVFCLIGTGVPYFGKKNRCT